MIPLDHSFQLLKMSTESIEHRMAFALTSAQIDLKRELKSDKISLFDK